MKVLTEGHKYELDSFEGTNPQVLQFIEKAPKDPRNPEPEIVTINDGTTNEEVIKVLIDRLEKMGAKFPCTENFMAINKLHEALFWLEHRTKLRKEQGVEGKYMPHKS